MFRLPIIDGIIRRRLLVNFRVDPDTVQNLLPTGFRPKLHHGHAIAGICLIRLEKIRPRGLPALFGIASENAAHRIAVKWTDVSGAPREGVYIPRRDTNSTMNALAGGRIFPGEHRHARFEVKDEGESISLSMISRDRLASLKVVTREAKTLPKNSCFRSVREASHFFEPGRLGYSATSDPSRLEGLELVTKSWHVEPIEVTHVQSSFFGNRGMFPKSSIEFDHGLVMRDIPHEWHRVPDFFLAAPTTST